MVLAAKLIGRTGSVHPFPSAAHYASYTGAAPLAASSGELTRHRLNRRGDRELNRSLHIMAVTQIRMRGSLGAAYFQRKRAEGLTIKEARRCLKRRLSDVVYRQMVADERAR